MMQEGLNSEEMERIQERNFNSLTGAKLLSKDEKNSNDASFHMPEKEALDNLTVNHRRSQTDDPRYDRLQVHLIDPQTDICPICHCEFDRSSRVKLMPQCGHAFHKQCIN
mmetsp:Transcript_39105/g.28912  ORF Transcript_39105/g.28912 Transcript_39105/m.28912 type:complete len:110 (-) Transcript_39105:100-429(-)